MYEHIRDLQRPARVQSSFDRTTTALSVFGYVIAAGLGLWAVGEHIAVATALLIALAVVVGASLLIAYAHAIHSRREPRVELIALSTFAKRLADPRGREVPTRRSHGAQLVPGIDVSVR